MATQKIQVGDIKNGVAVVYTDRTGGYNDLDPKVFSAVEFPEENKEMLVGVSSDGSGDPISVFNPTSVHCFGTFDGCNVNLEVSHDKTNWTTEHTFTEASWKTVDLEGPFFLRGTVDTAGASTDVSLVAINGNSPADT